MKIGVKTFKDGEFLRHFKDKVDFFEVMAIQETDYSFLKEFSLPIVIHAQHLGFGVNNANKTKVIKNEESINFAVNLANEYGADKIIIHPGEITDDNCSVEQAIYFLKLIKDKRILIENIPLRGNFLCATPEETKKFMMETGNGFCFDINHAIETAVFLKQDCLRIIKEFIKLEPKHYHIGGQKLKGNIAHLPLADSDIPLKKIMELIPKDAEITLETVCDIKKTEEDIKMIKDLIKE